jgi:hypothetical protein
MAETKLERCEADNPKRCQAVSAGVGQCPYLAVPGFQYCKMHHGQEHAAARRKEKHQYNLGKWQARIEEFEDHEQIKSLRSEIGITKMVLEAVVNKCEDAHDLMINSSKISELVSKIEKLVPLMQKMEDHAGITLDKAAVLQLADRIAAIMADYLEDPDHKAECADRIISAIVDAEPTKKE